MSYTNPSLSIFILLNISVGYLLLLIFYKNDKCFTDITINNNYDKNTFYDLYSSYKH